MEELVHQHNVVDIFLLLQSEETKMDTNFVSKNHQQPSTVQHLLPAVVPALLVSVGYVNPGKWAAAVDKGAHCGSDLVLSVFPFNVAAILCQYLSAQIAVVSGRDFASSAVTFGADMQRGI